MRTGTLLALAIIAVAVLLCATIVLTSPQHRRGPAPACSCEE